jgi:aryl-alcohol dehydrogenase-like predicted oxidoreductase
VPLAPDTAALRWPHAWSLAEESRPFIKKSLELGINFFDTANRYLLGNSEEILGRATGDFVRRAALVIATKVYGRMHPGPNGAGLSRKAIFVEIDASLTRHRPLSDPSLRSRNADRGDVFWFGDGGVENIGTTV